MFNRKSTPWPINGYLSLVLLWIAILSTSLVFSQRNPSISFISKDKIISIGDTLELKCQVQDADSYPVAWTKLGPNMVFISKGQSVVIPSNRHRIRYDDKDSTYTLLIEKVQEIDAGTYRCEITTSVNSNVSQLIPSWGTDAK